MAMLRDGCCQRTLRVGCAAITDCTGIYVHDSGVCAKQMRDKAPQCRTQKPLKPLPKTPWRTLHRIMTRQTCPGSRLASARSASGWKWGASVATRAPKGAEVHFVFSVCLGFGLGFACVSLLSRVCPPVRELCTCRGHASQGPRRPAAGNAVPAPRPGRRGVPRGWRKRKWQRPVCAAEPPSTAPPLPPDCQLAPRWAPPAGAIVRDFARINRSADSSAAPVTEEPHVYCSSATPGCPTAPPLGAPAGFHVSFMNVELAVSGKYHGQQKKLLKVFQTPPWTPSCLLAPSPAPPGQHIHEHEICGDWLHDGWFLKVCGTRILEQQIKDVAWRRLETLAPHIRWLGQQSVGHTMTSAPQSGVGRMFPNRRESAANCAPAERRQRPRQRPNARAGRCHVARARSAPARRPPPPAVPRAPQLPALRRRPCRLRSTMNSQTLQVRQDCVGFTRRRGSPPLRSPATPCASRPQSSRLRPRPLRLDDFRLGSHHNARMIMCPPSTSACSAYPILRRRRHRVEALRRL